MQKYSDEIQVLLKLKDNDDKNYNLALGIAAAMKINFKELFAAEKKVTGENEPDTPSFIY